MSLSREVWAFVKGTRPRPPPGPRAPLATLLLVLASLAHLPLVYLLVADASLVPAFALVVGLLAMGLAWSGGVSLEGRRRGTARAFALVGIAEGMLTFVPDVIAATDGARWLFLANALLCAGALWALVRAQAQRT